MPADPSRRSHQTRPRFRAWLGVGLVVAAGAAGALTNFVPWWAAVVIGGGGASLALLADWALQRRDDGSEKAPIPRPNEPAAGTADEFAARIRPGQPGQEAAFQEAYDAAGGADRLGQPIGEVIAQERGVVQHFDGGPTGEPAVLCAPYDRPAIAVARSVWNDLSTVGGGAPGGGTAGAGYPTADRDSRPYIGGDCTVIDLVGGGWGPSARPVRRGRLIRRSSGHALWRPETVFESSAFRDRESWTSRTAKMDLRLRVAARIPLLAGTTRITRPQRVAMLTSLTATAAANFIGKLAMRYGLDPRQLDWRETEDPDGYNDSRFAAYHLCVTGETGRPAIRAELWLTLPDGLATEVQSIMDLRIAFDVLPVSDGPPSTPDMRISHAELIAFFSLAWHITTVVLPLAAVEDPIEVPPAGAPRLELYIVNERPDHSGEARTLQTLDMIDLSIYGSTRRQHLRDLAVAVTTHLGRSQEEIARLVDDAMAHIAEDNSFRMP